MPGIFERLRSDRPAAFSAALGLLLLVSSTLWFATARDDRGRTARLTADAWYYHAYLPSLLYDGDVDFTDQYRITKNWYRLGKTEKGRPSNVFGIGPAVFEAPFFGLGADITRATGGRANGFSKAEVTLALYASVLFSLAALLMVARTLRRRFGGPYLAPLVPVLLACAGPVVYYAIRQPGYAHPFATFWAAWLIDRWDHSFDDDPPRSLKTWLWLGGLLGAAALARPQLGLWAVLFAPAVVQDLRGHRAAGRSWVEGLRLQAPRWGAGAALCGLLLLPQLLAWKGIYGHFFLTPQGQGFMRWDSPAWSEVLFSSRNGLFPWAPLYALSAVGLFVCAVRRPRLGITLIVGIGLQALANGAAWDWWAGGSFGGRRFDSCFAGFALGLAALVLWPRPSAPPGRWLHRLGVGLALLVAVVLALGNLQWAAKVSAPSARIQGGQAAHVVLRQRIEGPTGAVVAAMSRVANWPARAVFALRYDTSTEAYDYVVGHHTLGELYPGLNSFRGKTHERLALPRWKRKLSGVRFSEGAALMTGDRAQILLGLNRRGAVTLALQLQIPEGSPESEILLLANGTELARRRAAPGKRLRLQGTVEQVLRGINRVEIVAPVGTQLYWLDVRAPGNPRRN